MSFDASQPDDIAALLLEHGLRAAEEPVDALTVPGEGNMNLVRRVHLPGRTLIVKQARPWVEKYPDIPAPVGRTEAEAAFVAAVAGTPRVADRLPRLLAHDPARHVLVLEDLGPSSDRLDLYGGGDLSERDLMGLLGWLDALHDVTVPPTGTLANRGMRSLNHAHVFDLPFRPEPPVALDAVLPGLAALHGDVVDDALREAAATWGQRYLADGPTLVHGDLYPGSWLATRRGLRIIDAEFCFLGDGAWDHGVLLGHLVLAGQPDDARRRVLQAGMEGTRAYAAVEILRRLFGVAQLPLHADLAARRALAEEARAWLLD